MFAQDRLRDYVLKMSVYVEKGERIEGEVDVYTPQVYFVFLILTKQYTAKDSNLPKKRPKTPLNDLL